MFSEPPIKLLNAFVILLKKVPDLFRVVVNNE
jgi:hypothetical protein